MARKRYLTRPTRAKYEEFQQKRREANYICRRKKRTAWNEQLEDMEKNFKENNDRQAYKEVKFIKKGYAPRTSMIKDKKGEIVSTHAEVLERWKEHFQQLLNNEGEDEEIEEDRNEEVVVEEIERPDKIDVRMAIEASKNGKAAEQVWITYRQKYSKWVVSLWLT